VAGGVPAGPLGVHTKRSDAAPAAPELLLELAPAPADDPAPPTGVRLKTSLPKPGKVNAPPAAPPPPAPAIPPLPLLEPLEPPALVEIAPDGESHASSAQLAHEIPIKPENHPPSPHPVKRKTTTHS